MQKIRESIRSIILMALLFVMVGGNVLIHGASALNNGLQNPDLSQSVSGVPTGWETDNWGNLNASFSYLPEGQNDSASVRVTVSNYQDGDAKWYFDPITLTVGQTYTFSDYYRSDQTTNVWAQLLDQNGNAQYQWLGANAPSATWKQGTFNLTVPAGIVGGTIFHVLDTNGYLDTDTFSLSPVQQTVCSPSQASGLFNGSFAESCDGGKTPASWTKARYGTNTSTFSYLTTGYDDTRSVKTTISGYTNGESGWFTNPQHADGNQRYHFTGYLKSNVYAYTYVEVKLTDGSFAYLPMMSVSSTGSKWSLYDDVFVTPANTDTISIHVAISSVGALTMDNFHLVALPNYASNQLSSPLVSINFDDGDADAYTNALPVLNSLGLKATFYINGSTVNTAGYVTGAQLRAIYAQGNEIGSHSYHHYDLVTRTQTSLNSEISSNQTKLTSIVGVAPTTFATPYGSFNSGVLDTITKTVPYVRDTDNAMNYKYNFNPRTIHAKDVTSNMTTADIMALVTKAQQQGGWLVLVYHNVADSGDEYTVSKAKLQEQLQAIKASGVSIQTNQQAINTVRSQL